MYQGVEFGSKEVIEDFWLNVVDWTFWFIAAPLRFSLKKNKEKMKEIDKMSKYARIKITQEDLTAKRKINNLENRNTTGSQTLILQWENPGNKGIPDIESQKVSAKWWCSWVYKL